VVKMLPRRQLGDALGMRMGCILGFILIDEKFLQKNMNKIKNLSREVSEIWLI